MDRLTHSAYVRLFDIVGERFSLNYIDKVGYQYSHQWTTDERNNYVEWLADFAISKNGYAPKQAQMDAMWFAYKNGWQINNTPRTERI